MTQAPTYGFRLAGKGKQGALGAAIKAGDTASVKTFLSGRFPGLQFESLDSAPEQVDKPAETVSVAAPAAAATTAATSESTDKSTQTLFDDYMAQAPGVVRDLATTDYKGVRGGRLGRGSYTTESIIPGAQVTTPAIPATPTPAAASTSSAVEKYDLSGIEKYLADIQQGILGLGTNQQQQETTQTPNAPAAPEPAAPEPAAPASVGDWTSGSATYAPQAAKVSVSKGYVPSATTVGAFVPITSSQASQGGQSALAAVQGASGQGSGAKVQAAAQSLGDPGKLTRTEVAALISQDMSANKILNQAAKAGIQLGGKVEKQLEKQASKDKKK